MNARISVRHWVVLCVSAVTLVLFWSWRITDAAVVKDAGQNLRMALNLSRTGTISLSEAPPMEPSMQREPLPAVSGALAVRAVDILLGPAPASQYFQGRRAALLKYQNVPWLGLLSAVIFMIGWRLGLTFWLSLLCVLLANLQLLNAWYGLCMLDSLLTESSAAALLALGSLLLAQGVCSDRLRQVAYAGLCFGLLALVKAACLYMALGVAIALPGLALLLRGSVGSAARQGAVLGAVAALVVLPWMMRNYQSVGYFDIAGRGGEALYDRAVLDQMTSDEYVGSLYAWAPYPLGGVIRRLLGYSKDDFKQGGRLQRLNEESNSSFAARDEAAELAGRPQDTLTYYRRGRAERVILVRDLVAAGNPQPDIAADRELKKRALAVIRQHPLRHAALSLTLLWRGGIVAFVPLAVALGYALKRRRTELALIVLPSFALILFYTLFANFETRYAMPSYPIVACVLVLLPVLWVQRRRARRAAG